MASELGTVHVDATGGLRLAVHHLGGDGPPVLLAHANGLHGRCWEPMADSLTPAYTVWAVDLRGHGASGRDPAGRYDWDGFALDLLAVIDALPGPPGSWRGVGHSLGGNAVLSAEAIRPGTFSAAACYEPVVFAPAAGPAGANPLAEGARRRRESFASREEALANFGSKPPFAAFDPRALAAYVDYGFHDEPDGTVTLACRREDEAAIYEAATRSPLWGRLAEVRPPVTILAGGRTGDAIQRIAASVARRLPRGGYRELAHLDHFGPMTAPAEVGGLVASALTLVAPPDGGESTMAVTPPR